MRKALLFLLFFQMSINVHSQNPNWSVNASNYQYSMTLTTFLNVNGTTLSSSNDKVAAFINGEIRGVANLEYISIYNKHVAFLSIYANTNNEVITFKIYDSSNNTVITSSESENFSIDKNIGGVFQSYSIANPKLNNESIVNTFSFKGINSISSSITNNTIDIVLPKGTDLTNLVSVYEISKGANFFVNFQQQASGESSNNFSDSITYQLVSEDQSNLIEYNINVSLEVSNFDEPLLNISSISNSIINLAPLVVNLKTNVPIYNFEISDIITSNAISTSLNKIDDLNYTIQIVPIQQGSFTIEIPENKVVNEENEGNLASNKLIFTYDIINPYVLKIKRKNPIEEIVSTDQLEFVVTFSEAVENVTSSSFETIANTTLNVTKETDAVYSVLISNIKNHKGVSTLNIKSDNNIKDKAGNILINSKIKIAQN
jgi:hypothetical protein